MYIPRMTRLLTCVFTLLIPTAVLLLVATGCGRTTGATVVRRFDAPEANQAVAVDSTHFYAIGNSAVGKYEKATGRRVAGWKDETGYISHLNSGVIIDHELYCAHSNYPETPMVSSLEIFDADGMKHVRSIPLPTGIGSATWVDRADGVWWVTFANYAGKGGEAGRGPERTTLVKFDPQWQQQQSWTFPQSVVSKWDGMSSSGGAWGPGGALYTTGHDAQELYVLTLPASGTELILRQIIPFESHGQGIAIDRSDGLLYSIERRTHEVLVSRLPGD